jgi:hypothetical protein
MKRLIIVLSCVFMIMAGAAWAFETVPDDFEYNELLTPDRFNEVNTILKKSLGLINAEDLVGTWNAESVMHQLTSTGGTDVVAGWTLVDGMYYYLEDETITFKDNGDGTFSLATSNPNPLFCRSAGAVESKYHVVNNTLILEDSVMFRLQYINPYCYILSAEESPDNDEGRVTSIKIEKNVQPPDGPKKLGCTVVGKNIDLSWTDNSDDEEGFNIYRKDGPGEDWVLIDDVGANVTTYGDTVAEAGSYYYRIRAYLMDGGTELVSRGSNVELGKVE